MTVNILFFCIGAVFISQIGTVIGGDFWQIIFSIIILLAVIIFGEILPKAFGIKNPVTTARFACYPISVWEYISTPVRLVVMFISSKLEPKVDHKNVQIKPEELKMLLNIGKKKGAVSNKAGEMIEDIIALSNLRIKNIMTPRVDVIQCSVNDSVGKAISLAKEHKVFYLPILKRQRMIL